MPYTICSDIQYKYNYLLGWIVSLIGALESVVRDDGVIRIP